MIRRIELVMKSQNLTSSQFADKLGVQRSGLSHILSGRNKPSLDFVLKVLAGFPDLNPQWLLQGKGKMYVNMAEVNPPLVEAKKTEVPNPENREQAFLFGAFPSGTVAPAPATYPAEVQPVPFPAPDTEITTETDIYSGPDTDPDIEPETDMDTAPDSEASVKKNIARIVLFYTDGTFSEFQPNERA